MLKLGIITDQVSMDLEHALPVIEDLGIHYVEIHSLGNKTIENLSLSQAKQAQEIVRKYGLEVSNISATLFLMCHLKESKTIIPHFSDHFITKRGDYYQHLQALEYCIQLGEIFATDKIRIFGFRKEKPLDNETAINLISEKLRYPVELAEKAGVTLLLENCPHTYLQAGWQTAKVIEQINSENLKALWDPGNTLRRGTIPYPDDYEKTRQYLAHIHVKDLARENSDYRPVLLGEGEIDYRKIIRNLVEDNYEGVISLEPEYEAKTGGQIKSSKQSVIRIRKILDSLDIQV